MFREDPKRVATNEVRLSYCHLVEPYANSSTPGAKPKYSATLLIPKSDVATKREIDNAIKAAYEYGVQNKWKGARPNISSPLIYDGDGVRQNGKPFSSECKGHWVITASNAKQPGLFAMSNANIPLLPQELYSGVYARVTLTFYNPTQGNPVACGLDHVYKTRDGEPLSGGPSAADDFSALGAMEASTPATNSTTPAYAGYGQNAAAAPTQGYTPMINPITGQPM